MTKEKQKDFAEKYIVRKNHSLNKTEDVIDLDRMFEGIEAYIKEEMKDFAEYCHEHYKGSVRDNNGKSLYQYDDEVVWLLDEFLLYTHGSSI